MARFAPTDRDFRQLSSIPHHACPFPGVLLDLRALPGQGKAELFAGRSLLFPPLPPPTDPGEQPEKTFHRGTLPTLLKAQEALLAFPESGWRIDYGIGGWKSNPWFGKYASSTGWLYHHALGWVYLKQKSIDSIWLWQEELDWVWTNHTVFPYFFQNQPEGWLSLEPSSSQPALVYDFGNSVWFELDALSLHFGLHESRRNRIGDGS